MTKRRFGSIRKLPSGRWQATYSHPTAQRVTAPRTFRAKLDAEAWLADRRREIDRGLWNPGAHRPQRTRFDAYSRRWLANRDLDPRPAQNLHADPRATPVARVRRSAARRDHPAAVRDWHSRTTARQAHHAQSVLRSAARHHEHRREPTSLIASNPCRIRGAGPTQRVDGSGPRGVHELAVLEAAMPERLKLAVPWHRWCALRFGEIIETAPR